MKRQVDLETNINGDPKGFNTAARSATEHARRLERANRQLEERMKKMNLQMARSTKSAGLMGDGMATLAAGGATIAPAFLAAGAGVTAFTALAAPAIMRVVKAQEDLVSKWDSLSDAEKTSAAGLRTLMGQYKALARELEPETLAVFNQALEVTGRLMPKLAPTARVVAAEMGHFVDRLNTAVDSPEAAEFFSFLESSAGPATRQLGDVLGSATTAAMSLTQALGPLAGGGLQLVGMLLDLVAGISSAAPGLTQLAVLTMALRGPVSGLGDMLGSAGYKLTEFGDGASGVRGKATGLGKALSSAGAVLAGPWGVAVAAAVGLLGAFAASGADAAAQAARFEDAIRQDAGALGATTRALVTQTLEQEGLLKVAQANGVALDTYTDAILGTGDAHAQVTAQLDAIIAANRAKYDSDKLSFEGYKTGIDGAIQLKAALRGQNETIVSAVESYRRLQAAQQSGTSATDTIRLAWEAAADTGLTVKERVDALSAAFEAFFNPSLAVYEAATRLEGSFDRAREAIAKSHGEMGTQSAVALTARDAFSGLLRDVQGTAAATLAYTQDVGAARQAVADQLPVLYALAGTNRAAKAQVDALATSSGISAERIRALGDRGAELRNKVPKNLKITADTGQAWGAIGALVTRMQTLSNGVTVPVRYVQRGPGLQQVNIFGQHAAGGMVHGPGTGTSDSVPILASNGEYVINARATARHRQLLEAINADRFARGGPVGAPRGYAAGGPVGAGATVPLGDFVSRYMGSTPITKSDYLKVVRSHKDAVEQLRKAERKLADDRRHRRGARAIADDEARVRKERRDLATVTDKLSTAESRYKKSKMKPLARLTSALSLGIKNTTAFVRNLETIAKRGFPELAQQLLAMGGPEAEKYAAGAAKLSAGKLRALNRKVQAASKAQARLEALPNVLAVKAARKAGARSIPAVMKATGLSEDDLKETYAAMGYASGGIVRYARGGVRPGPGVATRPTLLMGEGRAPEGFVPYDPAYRTRAKGLVAQIAADFGMTRAMPAAAAGGGVVRVVLDVRGADSEMLRMMRKMVRVEGGGNVQVALGNSRAT